MVAFRKHVLPVFRRPWPSVIVGSGRPTLLFGPRTVLRNELKLISLLLLGLGVVVVAAFSPDGCCLRSWGAVGGGVGFGQFLASLDLGLDRRV